VPRRGRGVPIPDRYFLSSRGSLEGIVCVHVRALPRTPERRELRSHGESRNEQKWSVAKFVGWKTAKRFPPAAQGTPRSRFHPTMGHHTSPQRKCSSPPPDELE